MKPQTVQIATATPGPMPQRFRRWRAVHPVFWTLLFSCTVHGLLLIQTFRFQTTPLAAQNATVLVVRWLAPPPPTPAREFTVNNLASGSKRRPAQPAKTAAKASLKNAPQPAPPYETSRSESQEPSIATPPPQANAGSRPAYDSAPKPAPSSSPSESPSTHAAASSEPSPRKQTVPLDLSLSNLARAATQTNAPSLVDIARARTGLEPEPQSRVFAKRLAAATIPSCWSHTVDGEGQPLPAPSGNLLLLPLAAREAVFGKCRAIP